MWYSKALWSFLCHGNGADDGGLAECLLPRLSQLHQLPIWWDHPWIATLRTRFDIRNEEPVFWYLHTLKAFRGVWTFKFSSTVVDVLIILSCKEQQSAKIPFTGAHVPLLFQTLLSCTWLPGCACWSCIRRGTQTSTQARTLPTPAWLWSSSFPCWEWWVSHFTNCEEILDIRVDDVCRCLEKETWFSGSCSQSSTFWPHSSSVPSSTTWADGGWVRSPRSKLFSHLKVLQQQQVWESTFPPKYKFVVKSNKSSHSQWFICVCVRLWGAAADRQRHLHRLHQTVQRTYVHCESWPWKHEGMQKRKNGWLLKMVNCVSKPSFPLFQDRMVLLIMGNIVNWSL